LKDFVPMKISVLLASALLLTAPAFAQTSGGDMSGSGASLYAGSDVPPEMAANGESEDGASDESESDDSERRICRRVEVNSASRMPTRRLCLTARQWREHHRRTN
jgi:hypothetical protein